MNARGSRKPSLQGDGATGLMAVLAGRTAGALLSWSKNWKNCSVPFFCSRSVFLLVAGFLNFLPLSTRGSHAPRGGGVHNQHCPCQEVEAREDRWDGEGGERAPPVSLVCAANRDITKKGKKNPRKVQSRPASRLTGPSFIISLAILHGATRNMRSAKFF